MDETKNETRQKKNAGKPTTFNFGFRYTIFKDHITLRDYEIHDGMNIELYYQWRRFFMDFVNRLSKPGVFSEERKQEVLLTVAWSKSYN